MPVLAEEREVQSRLEQLGLTLEGLGRVVSSAAGGYNSTTSFHPSSSSGSYLYFEATASLRRLVMPGGDWEMDEQDGQPRTFNQKLGLAIVVQSGDEMTGVDGAREPSTRHPKGPATARKVAFNGQLEMFQLAQPARPEERGPYTWVLLIAVVDGVICAELSRPEKMSAGSRPCGWAERILLPSQPLGGMGDLDLAEPLDGGPDTDFDVSWQR